MDWFEINLRHLRLMQLAHHYRSLSKAAEAANVTQPAATLALNRLETQLDCLFFHRRSDGVMPTTFADVFVRRVEIALNFLPSNKVTTSQMRAFIAVADHGSFIAAAKALDLSSPSLSRSMRDLEIICNRVLLTGRRRGMAVTDSGHQVLRQFRLARAEIAAGLVELNNVKGREVGRISIGAMPLSRARVLPAAISNFRTKYPDVDVAVFEGSYREMTEPLRDGDLDILIGTLRGKESTDLEEELLFEDCPVVIGRDGHPLASRSDIGLEDLAAFEWAVPRTSAPMREQWENMFLREAIALPKAPIRSGSVMLIREMVRQSDMLTLLSADQVSVELEAKWLIKICPLPASFVRKIGVIKRANWRLTPLQQVFLDELRACC